jgi:hypothetical protein
MRTWTLTVVVLGHLGSAAYGQRPIHVPDVLAGPWEQTDATGIHGIFLRLGTHARRTADQPVITSQSVSVRVYHRQNGHETWGFYSPPPSGPADAPSVFDGQRLRIGDDRTGLLLDVTFDTAERRWTGTWSRDGQRRDVVLERPHLPPTVAPHPLTGDWDGLPDSTGMDRSTRLHVAQSSDQAFTIWMDRSMLLVDQRHGELLKLESIDHNTITLETTNVAGMRDRYQGTLSADGSTLLGSWGGTPGRTLNASSRFRRVP